MPKIPRFLVERPPALTTKAAAERVSPEAAAQGGQTIVTAGERLQQIGQRFERLADVHQMTTASTELQRRLQAIEAQALDDPDPFSAAKYQQAMTQARQSASRRLANPEDQLRLDGQLDQSVLGTQARVNTILRKRQLDASHASMEEHLASLEQQFYRSPPAQQALILSQADALIDERAMLGAISRVDAVRRKQSIRQGWGEGQIRLDMEHDPTGTIQRLDAGGYDQLVLLDPKEKQALRALGESLQRRREREARRAQDEAYRKLHLKAVDGQLTFAEAQQALASGQITPAGYNQLRKRLAQINDDPSIPDDQKTARYFELLEEFKTLHGTASTAGKLKTPARSRFFLDQTTLEEVTKFRQHVAESAAYLTDAQERAFYDYTQSALDEAQEASRRAKVSILESLQRGLSALRLSDRLTAASVARFLTNAMGNRVTLDQAAQLAQQIQQEQVIATNPNRVRYQVGQILSLPQGTFKVVGFYPDGEPDVVRVE